MDGKINLYGRARRLALYKNIGIIVGCIIVIIFIVISILKNTDNIVVRGEYDLLKDYFLNRGFNCESLISSGGRCVSTNENSKTTFYRFSDGFEYIVKTSSYSLVIVHRLEKEDEVSFKTTSNAFEGYRNQHFICTFDNNVLDSIKTCESSTESIILDVKSYLGVIEQSQIDLTNAINSSGYSLDSLLQNYEWIKK